MKKKDSKKQNTFQLINWNLGIDPFRKMNYIIDINNINEKHQIIRYFTKDDQKDFQHIYRITYMNFDSNISTSKDIQLLNFYSKIRDKVIKLKEEIDNSKLNDNFHIQINLNKINQFLTVEFISNEGVTPLFIEDKIDLYEVLRGSYKYYSKIYRSNSFLHDEISLDNFSLNKKNRLKITFYPLSIMIGNKSTQTKYNAYISKYNGKNEYIPPEVFINKLYDEKSEKLAIYSWTILILNLLRLYPKKKYFEDHQINEINHSTFLRELFNSEMKNSLQNYQIQNSNEFKNFVLNDLKNCLNYNPLKRPSFLEIYEKLKQIFIKGQKVNEGSYPISPNFNPYLLVLKRQNHEAIENKMMQRNGIEPPLSFSPIDEPKFEIIDIDLIEQGNISKKT